MLKNQSPNLKDYTEENLPELLDKTENGGHNEIWVKGISVDIIGAYVMKGGEEEITGIKKFMRACKDVSLNIHVIEIKKQNENENK